MEAEVTTYTCSVCLEDKEGHSYDAGPSDKICPECAKAEILPRLEAVLDSESNYPVEWGRHALQPEGFLDLLTISFLNEWRDKLKEYETPMQARLYCKHVGTRHDGRFIRGPTAAGSINVGRALEECGHFVGEKTSTKRDGICQVCYGWLCWKCCKPLDDPDELWTHNCSEDSAERRADAAAFEGLVRGKDYQLCPKESCKLPVGLADGCNHVFCKCDTEFCYICGQNLNGVYGHFSLGMPCPRYNHPSAQNAFFDEDDEDEGEVTSVEGSEEDAHLDDGDLIDEDIDFAMRFFGQDGEGRPERSAAEEALRLRDRPSDGDLDEADGTDTESSNTSQALPSENHENTPLGPAPAPSAVASPSTVIMTDQERRGEELWMIGLDLVRTLPWEVLRLLLRLEVEQFSAGPEEVSDLALQVQRLIRMLYDDRLRSDAAVEMMIPALFQLSVASMIMTQKYLQLKADVAMEAWLAASPVLLEAIVKYEELTTQIVTGVRHRIQEMQA